MGRLVDGDGEGDGDEGEVDSAGEDARVAEVDILGRTIGTGEEAGEALAPLKGELAI